MYDIPTEEELLVNLLKELVEKRAENYVTLWITGRLLKDLSLDRLAEHCEIFHKQKRNCLTECPIRELCEDMIESPMVFKKYLVASGTWEKVKDIPIIHLYNQMLVALRSDHCEEICPMGDGYQCGICLAKNIYPNRDYWRHDESELLKRNN